MESLDVVKSVLTQIKDNANLQNIMNLKDYVLTYLIEVIDTYMTYTSKDWEVVKPVDGDYGLIKVENAQLKLSSDYGPIINRNNFNGVIEAPRAFVFDPVYDRFYLCDSLGLSIFDSNFSYRGKINVPITNVNNCVINTTGDMIFISAYHSVFKIALDTFNLIWQFGDTTAGNPDTGHLYNPVGLAVNPSYSILYVAQMNGGTGNVGSIEIFDRSTGNYLGRLLDSTGQYNQNKVYSPYCIRTATIDNKDYLFVSSPTINEIRVFELTNSGQSAQYVYSIGSPSLKFRTLAPQSIALDIANDIFYAISYNTGYLGRFGLTNFDLLGYIGGLGYEDYYGAEPHNFKFYNPAHINLSTDSIFIADEGNSRIQRVPLEVLDVTQVVTIPCTSKQITKTPTFISSNYYDPSSNSLIIPYFDLFTKDNVLPPFVMLGYE